MICVLILARDKGFLPMHNMHNMHITHTAHPAA